MSPEHQRRGPVLALCGGIGGAKLALGLYRHLAPGALSVAVNTGDDFEHLGLHISPDIDTVLYTLSGTDNPETGWGRADETWTLMAAPEGLGGETPRNAWRRLTKAFHVNEPPDRDKMRAIFGIKKTYKIRAGGIHMLGLNYNSEHLEVHRRHVGSGVEVDVRVDAEDIGAISVRVGKDWLTVPCVHGGFDRVRLSDWIATLADIGRRFAREAKVAEPAVREALRAIQQVSANGIARSGIGARIDTVAEIERAERDLAISFTWAKPDPQISSTGAGLFDNLVPVGGDEPSAKAAPQIAPDDEASPSPTKPADRSAPARKLDSAARSASDLRRSARGMRRGRRPRDSSGRRAGFSVPPVALGRTGGARHGRRRPPRGCRGRLGPLRRVRAPAVGRLRRQRVGRLSLRSNGLRTDRRDRDARPTP